MRILKKTNIFKGAKKVKKKIPKNLNGLLRLTTVLSQLSNLIRSRRLLEKQSV